MRKPPWRAQGGFYIKKKAVVWTLEKAVATRAKAAPTRWKAARNRRKAAPTRWKAARTRRKAAPTRRKAARTRRKAAPPRRKAARTGVTSRNWTPKINIKKRKNYHNVIVIQYTSHALIFSN